jgi:hypothetical protein
VVMKYNRSSEFSVDSPYSLKLRQLKKLAIDANWLC